MSDNKRWIDDRHYQILHDVFDDHGKKIGEEWIEYTTNETKDTIYITDAFLNMVDEGQCRVGATSHSDYSGFSKKVVRDKDGYPEIRTIDWVGNGVGCDITITYKDGAVEKLTAHCE